MILRSQSHEIELVLREVIPVHQPTAGDLCVRARVLVDGFSGISDQVWIQAPEWDAFRAALRRLEGTREGEATVSSISPSDFRMRVRVVDRSRHLEVDGHIGRYRYLGSGAFEFRLTFAFELDAEYLLSWLAAVESFIQLDANQQ